MGWMPLWRRPTCLGPPGSEQSGGGGIVKHMIRRGLVVLAGMAVLFTAAVAFAAGNPINVQIKTGSGHVTVKPPTPGQCVNGAGHAHQTYTGVHANVKLTSSDAA